MLTFQIDHAFFILRIENKIYFEKLLKLFAAFTF